MAAKIDTPFATETELVDLVELFESLTLPFRDDARLRLPGEAPAEIEREG